MICNSFGINHRINHALFAKSSLWHERLAYVSKPVLAKFLSAHKIKLSSRVNNINTSTSCTLVKTHKFPFTSSHINATKPFDLVYIDIWGPKWRQIFSFNG